MVFKDFFVLVLRTKEASALEGFMWKIHPLLVLFCRCLCLKRAAAPPSSPRSSTCRSARLWWSYSGHHTYQHLTGFQRDNTNTLLGLSPSLHLGLAPQLLHIAYTCSVLTSRASPAVTSHRIYLLRPYI